MISVISDCVLATVRVAEAVCWSFIAVVTQIFFLRKSEWYAVLRNLTDPATIETTAGEPASRIRQGIPFQFRQS
jgi:hypothetical protein